MSTFFKEKCKKASLSKMGSKFLYISFLLRAHVAMGYAGHGDARRLVRF